ncbi:4-hydroxythreonine-4-phosphate dehydrogenase PdxA [Neptunicoccus cionae]|uniref:4-hydroxythreonine-4-phosphate dehydrogenase PdxA n=1 Tax=Neptunicoccus cionae TaxID=2035344 RepID=UPI000C77D310|nr:4-hydroxythreonine-4-phosphate dehydrogenase PdxA [Amylibacter cionae]PLS20336.1 4-hydroxythreonine-4-phosphate dehydrogenase PdxA [Amylibacter cionae]
MTDPRSRPIALTSGDPAGVGPGITRAAWSALKEELTFFVIGDPRHFPETVEISAPSKARAAMARGVPLLPLEFAAPATAGQPDHANAAGVIASIEQAVAFAKDGTASAVCTNPISKQVLIEGAGFPHPGHTEFLAELGGVERSVMMLTAPELSVVPVTIHIPLEQVKQALTADLLEDTIRITRAALVRDFGLAAPRIAIAGLNPHAGEGGVMGREEITLIEPVLQKLRAEGMEITSPLPADTMFHPAARATYDVAVCMYHDQALIPIKTLNFSAGVNVTLGLPFIRTSPDHGTAFGIAGKQVADATSLIEALRRARDMAKARALYDAEH